MADHDRSCWYLQECSQHPETGCTEDHEWFPVATDGRSKWVNCPVCEGVWYL